MSLRIYNLFPMPPEGKDAYILAEITDPATAMLTKLAELNRVEYAGALDIERGSAGTVFIRRHLNDYKRVSCEVVAQESDDLAIQIKKYLGIDVEAVNRLNWKEMASLTGDSPIAVTSAI